MKLNKKLIEVALPLEAINTASAREKSIRHAHPSTLHLWWARRPLAAARAVIFSQMVDDPSEYVETLLSDGKLRRKAEGLLRSRRKVWEETTATFAKAESRGISAPSPGPEPTLKEVAAEIERERLFSIIRNLVLWESTNNEAVLQTARDEIWQSWRRACADNADESRAAELFDRQKLPAFHDPFAGGGTLPLEAQRLGLESYASDLNPVAVLINKAMIEIPPKFRGALPVNSEARNDDSLIAREWKLSQGLAEDVRHYGQWMRNEAEKRVGQLYPKIKITAQMAKDRPDLKGYQGQSLTVIAWLWARTVKSPNPAFATADVPLASTFMLSTKPGKEAYVEPLNMGREYRFVVKVGKPVDSDAAKNGTKVGRGGNFQCLLSGTPIPVEAIRAQALEGTLGVRLMAIVAEGEKGRVYLTPTPEHEAIAESAKPVWSPDQEINYNPRDIRTQLYGLTKYGDLFTPRQLVALTTFSDLVREARERATADATAAGFSSDGVALRNGGSGAQAYGDAVGMYLGICVSRQANRTATLNFWDQKGENVQQVFARQALAMTWDFVEGNPFSSSTGNFVGQVDYLARVVESTVPSFPSGFVKQDDAQRQDWSRDKVISTDPPYYDNIGYADLSDFFYVWLRRSLQPIFPDLFSTLTVPKSEELVATPYRHGGKEKAEAFFLDGMTRAMQRLAEQTHPVFPVTIYYAFKQSESETDVGTASTGWETFLDAVIRAGFTITGTWPVRTELTGNLKKNVAALASSVVLVCRPRNAKAHTVNRREFVNALKAELPAALGHLQRGNIAPVDLAQAAIGPGMAIYTRYSEVLDVEGRRATVRDALALINQTLDEALAQQEGDFDADTRWALTWFEQSGFAEDDYGVAEQLSKSKNTSVAGMVAAGIIVSARGQVRLLKPSELPPDWDPQTDIRLTAWEIVHHLVRVLESGGEVAAATLLPKLGAKAEVARELAYRLYTLCERKKRTTDALSYNALIQSWPEITRIARDSDTPHVVQGALFGETED